MGTSGKNASEVLTRAYLPMQTLFMYDQMTVLAREAGAPLPPIRNPGLVIKDVTMPLIEGIHYDPNEFVIQPGKDLFKQDKLLALYGKKQKLDHYQLGLKHAFFLERNLMIHISDIVAQEEAMSELRPLITAHVYCVNSGKQDVFETLYYLSELMARRDMLRRVASDTWRDLATKCYNKGNS